MTFAGASAQAVSKHDPANSRDQTNAEITGNARRASLSNAETIRAVLQPLAWTICHCDHLHPGCVPSQLSSSKAEAQVPVTTIEQCRSSVAERQELLINGHVPSKNICSKHSCFKIDTQLCCAGVILSGRFESHRI